MPSAFPSTVMVAADGSTQSARAIHVAAEIAHRLGAELEAIVATGGQAEVDISAVRATLDAAGGPEIPLREDPEPPVDALTRLAPDLLVIGSRGLQGLQIARERQRTRRPRRALLGPGHPVSALELARWQFGITHDLPLPLRPDHDRDHLVRRDLPDALVPAAATRRTCA